MGYIILRALKRQKKKNVLLLIQFFVGFLAMFLAIAMVQNIWRYRQQIQQLVPERAIQMANYEEDGQTGEDKQVQAYEKVVQKLEKEKEIERILLFENIILQLDEQEEVEGLEMHLNTLQTTQFLLTKGSTKELCEYKGGSVIPILVTQAMESTHPYGSEFTAREETSKDPKAVKHYRVVGVISEKMKFWSGNMIPASDGLKDGGEEWFVTPETKACKSPAAFGSNLIFVPKAGQEQQAETKLQQAYEEQGITAEPFSVKKQIEEYYNGQKTFIFVLIFFAVILLFLSVLGCIGTILASIMQRKEEFGIYVSMGFTKRKLARLILGELGCLFAAAFILAVAMCGLVLTGMDLNTGLRMNGQMVGMGACIMLVCVGVSAVMPVRRVGMLQPIELMEGRR